MLRHEYLILVRAYFGRSGCSDKRYDGLIVFCRVLTSMSSPCHLADLITTHPFNNSESSVLVVVTLLV